MEVIAIAITSFLAKNKRGAAKISAAPSINLPLSINHQSVNQAPMP